MKSFSKGTTGQGVTVSSFLLFFLLFLPFCNPIQEDKYVAGPVPDFHEQETTFICWNAGFQKTLLSVIKTISAHDHITLFYNERYHQPEIISKTLRDYQVTMRNVELTPFNLENDNVWIRDYGPIFVHTENGNESIVSFKYDHEANQDYNKFGEQYASKMRLSFLRSASYSSGGGREINGKGTMLLIESYEKAINPGLSLAEIEAEYKKTLHQKKIIWLKKGLPQDDAFDNGPVFENVYGNGVNGHIDEFCRFADDNTILLAKVDPIDLKNDRFYHVVHQRLEENYEILKKALDQDGRPFRIIRVPQAPIIFNDVEHAGQQIFYTPVTSYLNYVITNKLVVVPSYFQEGDPMFIRQKDAAAKQAFEKIFSSRQVIMLDVLDLNYSGGGLHCITLHKPRKNQRPERAC